jgi:hypothetical protein
MLLQTVLRPATSAFAVASTSRIALNAVPQACRGYARQHSWADEQEEHEPRQRSGGGGDPSSWRAPRPQRDAPPHWTHRDGSAPKKASKKQPRVIQHPPLSEETLKRHAEERVRRAERLERKDLTAQLTPVKTCKHRSGCLSASLEIPKAEHSGLLEQTWAASRSRDTLST